MIEKYKYLIILHILSELSKYINLTMATTKPTPTEEAIGASLLPNIRNLPPEEVAAGASLIGGSTKSSGYVGGGGYTRVSTGRTSYTKVNQIPADQIPVQTQPDIKLPPPKAKVPESQKQNYTSQYQQLIQLKKQQFPTRGTINDREYLYQPLPEDEGAIREGLKFSSKLPKTFAKASERIIEKSGGQLTKEVEVEGQTVSLPFQTRGTGFGTTSVSTGKTEFKAATTKIEPTTETRTTALGLIPKGVELGTYAVPYVGGAAIAGQTFQSGRITLNKDLTPGQRILGGAGVLLGATYYGSRISKVASKPIITKGPKPTPSVSYIQNVEKQKRFDNRLLTPVSSRATVKVPGQVIEETNPIKILLGTKPYRTVKPTTSVNVQGEFLLGKDSTLGVLAAKRGGRNVANIYSGIARKKDLPQPRIPRGDASFVRGEAGTIRFASYTPRTKTIRTLKRQDEFSESLGKIKPAENVFVSSQGRVFVKPNVPVTEEYFITKAGRQMIPSKGYTFYGAKLGDDTTGLIPKSPTRTVKLSGQQQSEIVSQLVSIGRQELRSGTKAPSRFSLVPGIKSSTVKTQSAVKESVVTIQQPQIISAPTRSVSVDRSVGKTASTELLVGAVATKTDTRSISGGIFDNSFKQTPSTQTINKTRDASAVAELSSSKNKMDNLMIGRGRGQSNIFPRIRPPRETTKTPGKTFIPVLLGGEEDEDSKVPGFIAQIKRGGSFVSLGRPTSYGAALYKGSRATDTSLSRTFRVVPTGGKVRAPKKGTPPAPLFKFRTFKQERGRQVRTPNVFIERARYSLERTGEQGLIQKARRTTSTKRKNYFGF